MLKHKVFSFILLAAVLMSGAAYSQQATNDKQVRTISGKVSDIDTEGGVLNVMTDDGKMMFYIEAESILYRSTHHMASIEINKSDLVTIKYLYSSGKNIIITLVDKTPLQY